MTGSKIEKNRGLRAQDHEKIWTVGYERIRRHSRVLYLPISKEICDIHDIKKGDTVKFMLVEVFRAPRVEEENEEG